MGTHSMKAVSRLVAAEVKNNAKEANRLGKHYKGVLDEVSGDNSWPSWPIAR